MDVGKLSFGHHFQAMGGDDGLQPPQLFQGVLGAVGTVRAGEGLRQGVPFGWIQVTGA
jgi:hypothetical protein